MAHRMALVTAKLTTPSGEIIPRAKVQVKEATLTYTVNGQERVRVHGVISNMKNPRNPDQWHVTVEGDVGPEVWTIEQENNCGC